MKKKDLPQDKSSLESAGSKELCYVVGENGRYTSALSTGWEPKSIALTNAWKDIERRTEIIKTKVLTGKLSPLPYFMEKKMMDAKLLSQYTDIWQWRIKRHFKPGVFSKLKKETVEKYAMALDTTYEELTNFNGN